MAKIKTETTLRCNPHLPPGKKILLLFLNIFHLQKFSDNSMFGHMDNDFHIQVNRLIATAFQQARVRYQDKHKEWVRIAYRIGGQFPNSLVSYSVQTAGLLDIVLNSIEDEFSTDESDLWADAAFHYQILLSELWVGHVYEIFRLMKDRRCVPDHPDFDPLAHDLRLLRIPLEKHEIAGDKNLTNPLLLRKSASEDTYEYSRNDPKRSHIMPKDISRRGSVTWNVLDVKTKTSYWVERQQLSERIFNIYKET